MPKQKKPNIDNATTTTKPINPYNWYEEVFRRKGQARYSIYKIYNIMMLWLSLFFSIFALDTTNPSYYGKYKTDIEAELGYKDLVLNELILPLAITKIVTCIFFFLISTGIAVWFKIRKNYIYSKFHYYLKGSTLLLLILSGILQYLCIVLIYNLYNYQVSSKQHMSDAIRYLLLTARILCAIFNTIHQLIILKLMSEMCETLLEQPGIFLSIMLTTYSIKFAFDQISIVTLWFDLIPMLQFLLGFGFISLIGIFSYVSIDIYNYIQYHHSLFDYENKEEDNLMNITREVLVNLGLKEKRNEKNRFSSNLSRYVVYYVMCFFVLCFAVMFYFGVVTVPLEDGGEYWSESVDTSSSDLNYLRIGIYFLRMLFLPLAGALMDHAGQSKQNSKLEVQLLEIKKNKKTSIYDDCIFSETIGQEEKMSTIAKYSKIFRLKFRMTLLCIGMLICVCVSHFYVYSWPDTIRVYEFSLNILTTIYSIGMALSISGIFIIPKYFISFVTRREIEDKAILLKNLFKDNTPQYLYNLFSVFYEQVEIAGVRYLIWLSLLFIVIESSVIFQKSNDFEYYELIVISICVIVLVLIVFIIILLLNYFDMRYKHEKAKFMNETTVINEMKEKLLTNDIPLNDIPVNNQNNNDINNNQNINNMNNNNMNQQQQDNDNTNFETNNNNQQQQQEEEEEKKLFDPSSLFVKHTLPLTKYPTLQKILTILSWPIDLCLCLNLIIFILGISGIPSISIYFLELQTPSFSHTTHPVDVFILPCLFLIFSFSFFFAFPDLLKKFIGLHSFKWTRRILDLIFDNPYITIKSNLNCAFGFRKYLNSLFELGSSFKEKRKEKSSMKRLYRNYKKIMEGSVNNKNDDLNVELLRRRMEEEEINNVNDSGIVGDNGGYYMSFVDEDEYIDFEDEEGNNMIDTILMKSPSKTTVKSTFNNTTNTTTNNNSDNEYFVIFVLDDKIYPNEERELNMERVTIKKFTTKQNYLNYFKSKEFLEIFNERDFTFTTQSRGTVFFRKSNYKNVYTNPTTVIYIRKYRFDSNFMFGIILGYCGFFFIPFVHSWFTLGQLPIDSNPYTFLIRCCNFIFGFFMYIPLIAIWTDICNAIMNTLKEVLLFEDDFRSNIKPTTINKEMNYDKEKLVKINLSKGKSILLDKDYIIKWYKRINYLQKVTLARAIMLTRNLSLAFIFAKAGSVSLSIVSLFTNLEFNSQNFQPMYIVLGLDILVLFLVITPAATISLKLNVIVRAISKFKSKVNHAAQCYQQEDKEAIENFIEQFKLVDYWWKITQISKIGFKFDIMGYCAIWVDMGMYRSWFYSFLATLPPAILKQIIQRYFTAQGFFK
ncbi:hypothetical protein ABK040_011035 [Willaertia magna]